MGVKSLSERWAEKRNKILREMGLKRTRKLWTEEEDNILREYYPSEKTDVVKRLPGRSKGTIVMRAKKLKVNKPSEKKYARWTKEEDEILKANAGKMRYRGIKKLLKGRHNVESIGYHCRELGIKYKYTTKPDPSGKGMPEKDKAAVMQMYESMTLEEIFHHFNGKYTRWQIRKAIDGNAVRKRTVKPTGWTEEEDLIIKEHYKTEGVKCAERLPERTVAAVKARARLLGVASKRDKSTKKYTGNPTWTEEEDRFLKENAGEMALKEMVGHMKNSHSEPATLKRIKNLGLPLPAERGRHQKKAVFGEEDDEWLRKNYSTTKWKDIEKHFAGRYSHEQIKSRAKALKLKHEKSIKSVWTDREIEILKKNYETCTAKELYELIDRAHKIPTIYMKLHELGLNTKKARWTEEDRGTLLQMYKEVKETGRINEIPEINNKERTPGSIYAYVSRIKKGQEK